MKFPTISVPFSMGRTVATPYVLNTVPQNEIFDALRRHQSCDWGDVGPQDKWSNDRAVRDGECLLSVYHSKSGDDGGIDMKLTHEDKQLLKSWGNTGSDIAQISEAIHRTTYTKYSADSMKGKKISAAAAEKILGRKAFLSGIRRSAFHFTSVRRSEDGTEVFFDSHKLFL